MRACNKYTQDHDTDKEYQGYSKFTEEEDMYMWIDSDL